MLESPVLAPAACLPELRMKDGSGKSFEGGKQVERKESPGGGGKETESCSSNHFSWQALGNHCF